ncbi:lipase maturation factor family protein [Halorussus sp. MSC15.2]|uniref:lipase maturation factor family protein n=1 Tax=Halorussus sp. MSC15.2 TaxID=2283638 RepID=UPI0013D1C61A|nr:lipase maturation factor family protein [Halorussus sp. MSC15.2]NEU55810.1 lipase maturation factor family protein [Halorussus sp. MSC15.2]
MALWGPESYWLVRLLVHRGLAVVYLLAFLVAATQFRALVGEDGLLPVSEYVEYAEFRRRPSLFYLLPSDRAMGVAAWAGVGLSALALAGAPSWLPRAYVLPASMLLWTTLWLLYLSFVNAGRVFYGFGWESMLLETGFLAVFLGAGQFAAPWPVVWLLRWLLFRNMFGAGLIKIRGDECWRDLTCMEYHYETQPMPNPTSWYVHHLPRPVHRAAVAVNHVVELAVPFLYFAPQPVAALAGVATILFQGWLMVTGNFSWLNALTVVLAFATFADSVLASAFGALGLPVTAPATVALPLWFWVAVGGVTALVAVLSVRPTLNMVSSEQVMNTAFDPLHLVNTYGAFGSITRERYEIVVEGTSDEELTPDTEWETYTFEGKPTDPERRPPQVAPYHLRLDWQLWFAAMSPSPYQHRWFSRLLEKLLEGDEATLGLLRTNPFPDDPPTHVRAVRYRYEFTSPAERSETGRWWNRERVGSYVEPVSLDDLRTRRRMRRRGGR